MMILATLTNAGKTDSYIFGSSAEYNKVINNPENEIKYELELCLHGKTYEEKQKQAREIAVEYSWALCDEIKPLSWGESAIVSGWFENVGKRYGLLREFRENAIC